MSSYRTDIIVSLKTLEAIQIVLVNSSTKAVDIALSIEQTRSPGHRDEVPQEWNDQQQRWYSIGNKAREIEQMILDALLLEIKENIKEL